MSFPTQSCLFFFFFILRSHPNCPQVSPPRLRVLLNYRNVLGFQGWGGERYLTSPHPLESLSAQETGLYEVREWTWVEHSFIVPRLPPLHSRLLCLKTGSGSRFTLVGLAYALIPPVCTSKQCGGQKNPPVLLEFTHSPPTSDI